MKKHFISILIFLFLFSLPGCGNPSISEIPEDVLVLSQTIDRLSKINSYELTISKEESATIGDKLAISEMTTNQKVIFEPYTHWSKTDSTSTRIYDGGQNRTVLEAYQVRNGNQLDMFMRYSPDADATTEGEPVSGEWEKVSTSTNEQADWTTDAVKSNFDAQLYLLSSNIDTFKVDENSEEGEDILKYKGYLDQATILEAYQKYIRGMYVKVGLLKDAKDMTLDDLKHEITSGDTLEIKVGIPKLAYSEIPVPISLWIDKNTYELKKIMIDETAVMQAYMEKELPKANPDLKDPIVSKAFITYEIKSMDIIKEIPMP